MAEDWMAEGGTEMTLAWRVAMGWHNDKGAS